MTNPKARNAQQGARDAKPQRRPTRGRDALDAEILRDLDVEKSS